MKWGLSAIFLLALYTGAAQSPRLVLPSGHTSTISVLAYAPDGRSFSSGSWDNTIKIWESGEGYLLHDLKGHTGSILTITYSPDGRYFISTSKDQTARIWNAGDGRLLHTITDHSDWVTAAVVSADSRILTTADASGQIISYTLSDGKRFKTYPSHRRWVSALVQARKKPLLISGSWDSTVRIWDSRTGTLLHELRPDAGKILTLSLTRDEAHVLVLTDEGIASVWNAATGVKQKEFRLSSPIVSFTATPKGDRFVTGTRKGDIQLWNLSDAESIYSGLAAGESIQDIGFPSADNRLVAALQSGRILSWNLEQPQDTLSWQAHSEPISAMAFHPSRGVFITGSWDQSVKIWPATGDRLIGECRSHVFWVNEAVFDPKGEWIATESNDRSVRLWNRSGELRQTLQGHTDWVNTVTFSSDSKYLLSASNDHTARLWDLAAGELKYSLEGHDDWVNTAVFSPDNKYAITASSDQTARIWRLSNGTTLHILSGHEDWVTAAEFSADGRLALTASIDNTVRVWEVETGALKQVLKEEGDSLRTAVFSPDGRSILTSSKNLRLSLWSVENGQKRISWPAHTAWINKAFFSPDGKLVVSLSQDHTAQIWSASDGQLRYTLRGHTAGIASAAFSASGDRLATASWDHTVRMWSMQTGQLLYTGKVHEQSVNSVRFSPDDTYLLTAAEDNTIQLWQASSGKPLFRFFAVDQQDYLVMDSEGRYDGSTAARRQLYYLCGNERTDLEQLKELSWEPGLGAKLAGVNPEPVTALPLREIRFCEQLPRVTVKPAPAGQYRFFIQPGTGGMARAELYVNQKRVKTFAPSALVKDGKGYQLTVPNVWVEPYFIPGADNTVSVTAQAAAQPISSRGAILSVRDKKKKANPDLYIISIGVSRYKTDKLLLKYASKDARELGNALTGAGRRLLNTDRKNHVYTYILNTDTTNTHWPSKKNILRVLDTVARRAQPDDVVLLFFAGHGLLYNTGKTFYLLTAEASGFNLDGVSQQVAFSADELNAWMCRTKANKQVLILDACNSGKVIQDVKEVIGRRTIPADQQRALERLKDKTGTFILSAAAADQSAYETSLYRQGLLTYSLLTGLKLGQGLKDQRYIDVNRWFNFAADNVKILAKDIGGRQDPQIIGNGSFDLGMVDEEVAEGIQLSIRRKVFRQSRFIQDEQLLNDDLELSDRFDRELDNVSQEGKEVPIVFVPGNKFSDAYSLRGRYQVQGDSVRLSTWIVTGEGRKIWDREWVKPKAEMDDWVAEIVKEVVQFFNKPE